MARDESITQLITQSPRRPILTHLNADTSWLISFPQPCKHNTEKTTRSYYHVLVDPWLDGDLIVQYRWILILQHSIKASFQTIQDVRDLIRDMERAAGTLADGDNGEVDSVLITHYLDDHCHKASLLQIDAAVPIVTVGKGACMVESWGHFTSVETMPDLDLAAPQTLWQSDRDYAVTCLPSFLRVGRLPSGPPFPELHWATLIAFSTDGTALKAGTQMVPETIFYSPHGIYAERVQDTSFATEHSRVLALLHGLDPAFSPQAANLGIENGEKLAKKLGVKYWVPTHDEHLSYGGVIGWFQSKYKKEWAEMVAGDSEEMVRREIENGESFVLV